MSGLVALSFVLASNSAMNMLRYEHAQVQSMCAKHEWSGSKIGWSGAGVAENDRACK